MNCNIEKLEGITIEIAKTIVKVFKKLYDIKLEIKYPNDIMYQDKKIGGILTETKIEGNIVKSMVIGIGINTNQEDFILEIEEVATSIKKEFGIKVKNQDIVAEFCNQMEEKIIKRKGEETE